MNRGNSLATASSSQLSGESARPTGGFLFWSSIFAAGLFAAAPASAAIITFDEAPPSLVHGSIVTTQYVGINGVTISAINPNRSHNLAVAFNTLVDPDDTTDDDLVGPPTEDWDFGNLSDPVQVELKNILIVQENNTGIVGGVVGDPDDEGSRPHAGDLIFEFATAITQFGFSIVDVEGAIEPGTFLTFFMGGAELAEVPFTEFTNAASVFFDATVVFGDNSANKLPTITGPFSMLSMLPSQYQSYPILPRWIRSSCEWAVQGASTISDSRKYRSRLNSCCSA